MILAFNVKTKSSTLHADIEDINQIMTFGADMCITNWHVKHRSKNLIVMIQG